MEIRIYGLVDPRDNKIRYVGKTKNTLKKRLSEHLYKKENSNTYKHNWISSLKNIDLKPFIIELEVCDETNWVEREQHWISKIDNLTNLTAGGEGVNFFADEVLQKISESSKKKWEDPIYRKNVSDKQKLYWSIEENRKAMSLKTKGKKTLSDDHKEILKSIKSTQWVDKEYRETMSKQSSDLWKDKEYKEKVLKFLLSDENRKLTSDRFKGIPKSEETKKNMSKGRLNKQMVIIEGVTYESITVASKLIPMDRGKLRVRLKSKHFTEYNYV
jgi:hypothetical protein